MAERSSRPAATPGSQTTARSAPNEIAASALAPVSCNETVDAATSWQGRESPRSPGYAPPRRDTFVAESLAFGIPATAGQNCRPARHWEEIGVYLVGAAGKDRPADISAGPRSYGPVTTSGSTVATFCSRKKMKSPEPTISSAPTIVETVGMLPKTK